MKMTTAAMMALAALVSCKQPAPRAVVIPTCAGTAESRAYRYSVRAEYPADCDTCKKDFERTFADREIQRTLENMDADLCTTESFSWLTPVVIINDNATGIETLLTQDNDFSDLETALRVFWSTTNQMKR